MNDNIKNVEGVELEAIRFLSPVPHWRVKVVATGYIYDSGCFHNKSRPQLWEDVTHIAKLRGDLWIKDNLTAHNAESGKSLKYILWAISTQDLGQEPKNFGDYDRMKEITLSKQGWICSAYALGSLPIGLIELSKYMNNKQAEATANLAARGAIAS